MAPELKASKQDKEPKAKMLVMPHPHHPSVNDRPCHTMLCLFSQVNYHDASSWWLLTCCLITEESLSDKTLQ